MAAVPHADDPGTGAWLRLEIGPLQRTVSATPRQFVAARATWAGHEHGLTIDPVIALVVGIEVALVALGLARRLMLDMLF